MLNASDRKCENPYRTVAVSVSPCYLCLLSILANVLNRNNRRHLSGIYRSPCSRVLPKPTFPQVVKKFPAFYGTWRFIAAFTTARLSLSRVRSIQCTYGHTTSYWLCHFPAQTQPGINTPHNPSTDILHSPAYEDGTDSEFRNVGNYNSDASELPKKE